ncbi:Hsp20/alpha crystallin family protein [Spongiactinospora sp. TRM90649]|uniref:Hsp20/alpha crystallin family protein n=1 Tax=Spongiactinospora sp. TRM90649 TaxID=3031114 RepID=UPI0023F68EB5|nr:Hsp20/alpha crystallin family protein [Spongiactinospora sp. TRM90649]MDF5756293.1 Hsp20/alpha crystallin family protein [Spongiactinospora sp. TRM90649]
MGTLERQGTTHALFPELFEWLQAPWGVARTGEAAIRVEDYVDDGDYVVRAELPGLDPDKDVEITVSGGVLQLHAERREERKQEHHSEFRYGSLSRSLTLPRGVKADDVKATYDKGILTVTVPMPREQETQRISIEK